MQRSWIELSNIRTRESIVYNGNNYQIVLHKKSGTGLIIPEGGFLKLVVDEFEELPNGVKVIPISA